MITGSGSNWNNVSQVAKPPITPLGDPLKDQPPKSLASVKLSSLPDEVIRKLNQDMGMISEFYSPDNDPFSTSREWCMQHTSRRVNDPSGCPEESTNSVEATSVTHKVWNIYAIYRAWQPLGERLYRIF